MDIPSFSCWQGYLSSISRPVNCLQDKVKEHIKDVKKEVKDYVKEKHGYSFEKRGLLWGDYTKQYDKKRYSDDHGKGYGSDKGKGGYGGDKGKGGYGGDKGKGGYDDKGKGGYGNKGNDHKDWGKDIKASHGQENTPGPKYGCGQLTPSDTSQDLSCSLSP